MPSIGDSARGPRIITDETKVEMKKILKGNSERPIAKEFILENKAGRTDAAGATAQSRTPQPNRSGGREAP